MLVRTAGFLWVDTSLFLGLAGLLYQRLTLTQCHA